LAFGFFHGFSHSMPDGGAPEPLGKRHAPAFAPIRQSAAVDPASLLKRQRRILRHTASGISQEKACQHREQMQASVPQARHLEVIE
jgi:hypothetical protein